MRKRIAALILRFIAFLAIKGFDVETAFYRIGHWLLPEFDKVANADWEWDGDSYYDDEPFFPFLGHKIHIDDVVYEYDEEGGLGGYYVGTYKMNGKPLCDTLHGLYEESLNEAVSAIADSWD